ncbi:FecR domain-containing protein, partial [candidate division KSB1 bacterium]|nr:FecR domain-containing protein [candidate division KSB1 bacterium]
QLPDGSLVVLNAHSTLRFSSDWGKASERSVMLHGEAYFEVVPRMRQNSTEPLAFVVRTGDGEIRVVGTKFVVYERNFGTRVVVEEGSVKVNPVNAKAAQTLLAAGQLSEFRRGDTSVVTQSAGSGFHTTWWREDWQLEGTTFAEVIRRLEETYNVRVEVQDEALLQRKLSGAVENRDLEILIAALAKALRVDVSREGSVIKFGDSLDQEQ